MPQHIGQRHLTMTGAVTGCWNWINRLPQADGANKMSQTDKTDGQ
jgi:hypothetical protein